VSCSAPFSRSRLSTPLACGADTVATIGVNGEVDTYSFSGVAGEVVSIAVGENAIDNLFEPCWQLFAPGGAPVNALTCALGGTTAGTIAQVITLADTGTYTISVNEQQGTRGSTASSAAPETSSRSA
jgi:hypothetical protein